ncbi:ribonuclease H family protein [Colwellia echini]|uniref:ribonuclease H n=1 Tax=Colwellia echini TaxID=1982103 RepID=A0ABY3MTC8_9GAMM|nr:ribonuclease H family protein [Colwellia echini]TYK64376.1 ribonuclease HI [Colwellia echini]
MSKKFYVIWKGAKTGIFNTWPEVQQHTAGRSDAQYMGFESKNDAEAAFASTYTKALMQRSLSKKGGASAAPSSSRKSSSKASTKTATVSANGPSDIEIYCDGACSPNPGKSGTGLAVYEHGKVTSLYYGLYLANGTNNTAELSGLLSSFQIAQHFIDKNAKQGSEYSICILSDSKYSIDCITKWAKGWQAKGWTRGKGEEVKNLALVQQCYSLYKTIQSKITIRHVKGHANIEGNELADRMAVLARKQQQESMIRYAEVIDIKAILAMESA